MSERDPAGLLSVDEAAEFYRLGKQTLWRWLRDGKLKRYRRAGDRRTLIETAELEHLLKPRQIAR